MARNALWPVLVLVPGLCGCSHRALTQGDGEGPGGADGSTCEMTYRVGPVQSFACAGPTRSSSPNPVLTTGDGRVVYTDTRTLGSNSATDTDIFTLRPATGGTEQITGDDRETLLFGADGASILYAREESSYPRKRQLMLRLGEKTVFLGQHDPHLGTPNLYAFGPSRPVDGQQAAWRTKDGVYLHDGSQIHKVVALADKAHYGSGPYLRDGQMVWSQWVGEDLELILYQNGKTRQITHNTTADRYPVVSGGRVYWRCDAGICTWTDGASRVLDRGECGPPDVHRGSAAWICDNRVTLFEGKKLRRLTSGGDTIERVGVRLHDGRLVWLEIRDPKNVHYQGRATLVFSDTRTQTDVAEVGLPCLVCGAYWPPLSLSLSSGLVAWNYVLTPASSKPSYDHCACAEIEGRCL